MRLAVITGWILLIVEASIVAWLFLMRNMGDDAAGRGMARGFAMLLGPIVLLAAALFVWGQRGGPRAAFWVGFGIMTIPLVLIVINMTRGTLRSVNLAAGKAQFGKFDDGKLTRLARAIEKDDTAAVRALIAEGGLDFEARSRRGRTILGRAVEHATGSYAAPSAVEVVRMLMAAGAKPITNAIEPEAYQGDLDAHLLVAYVFGGNSANTIPLLDLLLSAGADPNTRNYEGQPLYFSTYSSIPKLEVLAKYGADFTSPDTTRSDRDGWTAAMFAAELGEYEQALFFLDHGVSPTQVAPDGTSLKTIVAAKEGQAAGNEKLLELKRRIEGAAK